MDRRKDPRPIYRCAANVVSYPLVCGSHFAVRISTRAFGSSATVWKNDGHCMGGDFQNPYSPDGAASAAPPARAHRAGGTALANVEPEGLSHLLASPSPQDSSLQVLHCQRHALPDTNVTVCSDRAGDHGAALYHSIAVPGPKLASRGRTFPVHPAASRCPLRHASCSRRYPLACGRRQEQPRAS